VDRRGRSPVAEFLDALPAKEQAEAARTIDLLQEFGIHLGMPHARPVIGHPKLWELRPGPNRIFPVPGHRTGYFAHVGRTFILLHAYRKKGRKAPEREIAIAERRLAELLEET
jgi:phage-related protein